MLREGEMRTHGEQTYAAVHFFAELISVGKTACLFEAVTGPGSVEEGI